MRFFEEKVHSLSVAPEPLAVWNKELEGLESDLFEELKSSPVAASEHFLVVCLLSGVVVWWWLRVNVACSRVVQRWHILPNMLVFEYCSLSPESSIIEPYLFTVSFVRLVSLVLLVHVHCFFRSINTLLVCCFDSSSTLLRGLKSP